MKFYSIVFLFAVFVPVLIFAAPQPQVEHGNPNAPSGRFEKTKNLASPPVDLSLPPIFLPEATPISEDQQDVPAAANTVSKIEVSYSP